MPDTMLNFKDREMISIYFWMIERWQLKINIKYYDYLKEGEISSHVKYSVQM